MMQGAGLDFTSLVSRMIRLGGGSMRPLRLRREQTCQGPLVLIDRAHPLQEGRRRSWSPWTGSTPQVLLGGVRPGCWPPASRSVGGGRTIVPVSGWRSRAEQQAIWDDTRAGRGMPLPGSTWPLPGCSEHQTGLAIDLGGGRPRS